MPWPDAGGAPLRLANRLLGEQDWARAKLAPFFARTFAIDIGPLHTHWAIEKGGTLVAVVDGANVDLQLTISPFAVPALAADPTRWNELVREAGDAELGGALKDLAQTTPWLVEKMLAEALGPVAGQRAADLGRDLLRFPTHATERLTESVVSYARDEAQLLVRADAMRRFVADLADVAARVDGIEARLAALTARSSNAGGGTPLP